MPSRRVKSIMHGSAVDTRIYHREHRSKNGRKKIGTIKYTRMLKSWGENQMIRDMEREKRIFLETWQK